MFKWKKIFLISLIVLIGFSGFQFGRIARHSVWALSSAPQSASLLADPDSENYGLIQSFMTVLSFVENNYVDKVSRKTLIFGAIKGMLDALDPHSHFLSAEEFKDMQIDTRGEFGGIGIEIGMKDNILTIMNAIEDTPAAKLGLQKGDRITKINGESTFKLTLMQAVSKMRGKVKTDVLLTIYRESFKPPHYEQVFKVTRDTIKIRPVKSEMLEPEYGYVRLSFFNEHASHDLQAAIEKMAKSGKLKGIVFDLRNNSGGLLDQAVEVSSLFLKEGLPVVSTIGRDPSVNKEVRTVLKASPFAPFEVVILVNASTASAAEIVAGALHDHKRAMILGQSTFGKGSVQTVTPLSTDIAVKLTTARYYTPSGISIQEKGVQPDIVLERYDYKLLLAAKLQLESFREKDLKGHMSNPDKPSEEEELSSEEKKEQEKAAKAKLYQLNKKKGDDEEDDTMPIVFEPKKDMEVKEALIALKSQILLKANMGVKNGL